MAATKFTKETYLYWYEMMLLLRRFEEKTGQLYGMQKIRGFCHLYIGQEALAAGCMTATRQEDPFITAYRDHGLALAKGMSANTCMAELYGKATGCSKGKGGSMHFFGVKEYFFGGHGIVGAQIFRWQSIGWLQPTRVRVLSAWQTIGWCLSRHVQYARRRWLATHREMLCVDKGVLKTQARRQCNAIL